MKIRRKVPTRELFATLLEQQKRKKYEHSDLYRALQEQLTEAFKRHTGKAGEAARERAVKKLPLAEYNAIRDPYAQEYERRYGELKAEIEALEKQLRVMAPHLKPLPGDQWLPFREKVYASTYSSQGLGARSYARGSCVVVAKLLESQGWTARVVDFPPGTGPDGKPYGSGLESFQVEVQLAEALDVEILKRSHAPALRDQVKATLKAGLNIRVFSPFLPHGIEAKLGLDHFGNDLQVKVPV